ncbi:phosphatase PAP2 family protein [Trujillonella humicola]|uniref:phosphatase PAP2 family protein n=1 Tax=Trujillonella humicola TaxID=3383699 RepID=UPI003905BE20
MTSGVVRRSLPAMLRRPVPEHPPVVSAGRPTWWAVLIAVAVAALLTLDLLGHGLTERVDHRVSDQVAEWGLRDSAAYQPLWLVTQIGGRGTMLLVLACLVGWLLVRYRTVVPLLRVVLALVLLSVVVYQLKWGIGRTAPAFAGGQFLHHPDGESFPSGHVANAVLLWGVARWQAVEFGLPARAQRILWFFAVVGPVLCGLAMIVLNFHWVSDAVAGAAVGVVLLGVVHAVDALVLSRWVGAAPRRSDHGGPASP